MIQVKATILAPEVDLTRREPTSPVLAGEVLAGQTISPTLQFYNDGNVTQVITMNSISDLVNCTIANEGTFIDNMDNMVGDSITLQPGQGCRYYVVLQADYINPGSEDEQMSANFNYSWSY